MTMSDPVMTRTTATPADVGEEAVPQWSGPPVTAQWKHLFRRVLIGSVAPIALVAFWELLDVSHSFPEALVPPPAKVWSTLMTWLTGSGSAGNMFYAGHLLSDTSATLVRVIVGFALASAVGVVLGTAIGVSRLADEALSPLVRILGPVPPITWIPVAIVLLGIGNRTNYFITFLGAVFPILSGTAVAVAGVSRDLLRVGRMMGRRGPSLILSVVMPAALPGILGGLRLGLGLSWMMAVTSEMLAVHSGLGYTLWNAYNYLDYPAVFAAMIVTGICGLVSDGLLRFATKPTVRWHVDTGVRA